MPPSRTTGKVSMARSCCWCCRSWHTNGNFSHCIRWASMARERWRDGESKSVWGFVSVFDDACLEGLPSCELTSTELAGGWTVRIATPWPKQAAEATRQRAKKALPEEGEKTCTEYKDQIANISSTERLVASRSFRCIVPIPTSPRIARSWLFLSSWDNIAVASRGPAPYYFACI